MCGICGIVGQSQDDDQLRIEKMLERMAHRGPDGFGVWSLKEVSLGHGRLAIVDISDAGAQPMHHPSGIHCSVNGEIYNYAELRKELENEYNVVFSSNCDSEIVLHGYSEQGIDFFSRMNGMFAFAIYDEKKETILLVRDRVGIKPLYYTIYNNQFIFASEIKGLFGAIGEKDWKINPLGLSQYMTYQSALGNNTLFQGVFQLRPGELLTINLNKLPQYNLKLFCSLKQNENVSIQFDEAVDEYRKVFSQSVKRHLMSDVPVSTYLSAGFDSSSVLAQVALQNKRKLSAYTGWFNIKGGWYDETIIAGELIKSINGNHLTVAINDNDLFSELDNIIDALDEPKMGMGAFPQYMVAKEVAKNYKVILTGHGGDELFSGYPIFKLAQKNSLGLVKSDEIPHYIYFFLSKLRANISPEYGRLMPVLWSIEDQKKMLRIDTGDLKPWLELQQIQEQQNSLVDKVFQTYLSCYLPNLLVVEDKISMAHQLESRTPMLDNDMLKLSLQIPQSVKLHQGELKSIIKAGARDLLPKSYYEQPKRGFPTPLRLWLRSSLNELLEERLLGKNSRLTRLFDKEILKKIVLAYQVSLQRHIRPLDEIQTHRMWQLLSLESWLRVWEEKYDLTLRIR